MKSILKTTARMNVKSGADRDKRGKPPFVTLSHEENRRYCSCFRGNAKKSCALRGPKPPQITGPRAHTAPPRKEGREAILKRHSVAGIIETHPIGGPNSSRGKKELISAD